MTEVARFEINQNEIDDACNRICGALERVEHEQDIDTAVRHGIKGLHGNVCYLMRTISEADVVAILDDLKANILESIQPPDGEAVH